MYKKTAQALKAKHKIRRVINPTGKALTMLNPAFKKVIRDLDKLDKQVRKEAEDLNYFIGMARSFVRRNDYLTAATYLVKFHEKAKLISHELETFDGDISKTQREFLLKTFKGKDKSKLFDYDPSKKIESINLADDGLMVQAGVIKDWWRTPGRFSDLLHNVVDRKSHSMRAIEKNFSIPFYRQLKEDTIEMLDYTNDFYKEMIGSFHQMGSAWATRNVGEYIEQIKEIESSYNPYNVKFIKYHQKNILPMKQEQDRIDADEKREQEKIDKEKELSDAGFAPLNNEEVKTKPTSENNAPHSEEIPFSTSQPSNTSTQTPNTINPPTSQPETLDPSTIQKARSQVFKDDFPSIDNDEIIAPKKFKVPSFDIAPPKKNAPTNTFPQTMRSPGVKDAPDMPTIPSLRVPSIPSSSEVQKKSPEIKPPSTQKSQDYTTPSSNDQSNDSAFSFNAKPGHNPENVDNLMSYELKKANDNFMSRILLLSSKQDIIKEILNHSSLIENYSEEDSLKLLAIAEGMIIKNSGAFDRFTNNPSLKNPSSGSINVDLSDLEPSAEKTPEQDKDILSDIRRPTGLVPVKHDIPQGSIEKRWSEIPFLAKIKSSDIKLSSATYNHLLKKLIKYFHHNYIPYDRIPGFNEKIVEAIKKSIVKSKLVSNMMCSDKNNPRDCQLEVFAYIRLNEIDPFFEKMVVSYTASLRLSAFEGEVTIKTISDPKLHETG